MADCPGDTGFQEDREGRLSSALKDGEAGTSRWNHVLVVTP